MAWTTGEQAVGVPVGVEVTVGVAEFVGVPVTVAVGVLVAVACPVGLGVKVLVLVKVPVGVEVITGVLVGVLVGEPGRGVEVAGKVGEAIWRQPCINPIENTAAAAIVAVKKIQRFITCLHPLVCF